MKKIVLIVACIFLFASLSVGAVFVYPIIRNNFEAGKAIKEATTDKGKVVALVDNEPIYESSINSAKISNKYAYDSGLASIEKDKDKMSQAQYDLMKSKLKLKTDKEILDGIIANRVLINEAKKLSITATNEEAMEQIENTEKQIKGSMSSGTDETMQRSTEFWNNYLETIKGYGYTYEEYKNGPLLEGTKTLIMIDKLYKNFLGKIPVDKKADSVFAKSEFEKYKNDLISKANIKIN
jgi:hypothetical protein